MDFKDFIVENMSFVVTGTFRGLTRSQVESALRAKGARVIGSVSGKTDYLLVGETPGASKLGAAEKHQTPRRDIEWLENYLEQFFPDKLPFLATSEDAEESVPYLYPTQINIPESYRKMLSILWDANGRPPGKISTGVLERIEHKLGIAIPNRFLALLCALFEKPNAVLENIIVYRGKSIYAEDGEGDIRGEEFIPKGYFSAPQFSYCVESITGDTIGWRVIFGHGKENNNVACFEWETMEVDMESSVQPLSCFEKSIGAVAIPKNDVEEASYDYFLWLLYGDMSLKLVGGKEKSSSLETFSDCDEDESEDEDDGYSVDDVLSKLAQKISRIDGDVHTRLNLAGLGYAEFEPSLAMKDRVKHKKFGFGSILYEVGKDKVAVRFENGDTKTILKEFLEGADSPH